MSWRFLVNEVRQLASPGPILGVTLGMTASVTAHEAKRLLNSFKLDERRLRELRESAKPHEDTAEAGSSE
jgi:hypothetical protein